jgi:multidrug efflux system outer membrane protein
MIFAAILAGGCSFMPDYRQPPAPVPAMIGEGAAAAVALDAIAWRDYFADDRLRQAIALALEHNRDLRIAALNIEKARAQYGIQKAELFPAIGAEGSQSAQRLPSDLSLSGKPMISRQYTATIGFTAYELDFFGRIRSLNAQALELYLGSEEARRSAQISLVAEVARAWLALGANRERLALAEKTLATRLESVKLIRHSFEVGAVSALDLHQAESLMETARGDVARYRTQVAQDEHALMLVVGTQVPDALLPAALTDTVSSVAAIPAGVPSDVLLHRPDILQTERALRAANASIGAARAAFFPSISLTAGAGSASASLDGLFGSGSGVWSFIPRITIPIFTAGRLQANLDLAEIQRDINVAQYEKAIQAAFREVADVLSERANIAEQITGQENLVKATADSQRLAQNRYNHGADTYLALLDAQRTRYAAEQGLIGIRLAEAINRVTLYKALGGGWQ